MTETYTTKELVEVVVKYYPDISDEQMGNLLWEATCFPFGTLGMIEKNLQDHIRETDGTVQGAIDRSMEMLESAAADIRSKNENR